MTRGMMLTRYCVQYSTMCTVHLVQDVPQKNLFVGHSTPLQDVFEK